MKKPTMTPEREAEWQAQHAELMARVEASRIAEPVLTLVAERSLEGAAGTIRSRANLRSGRR